MGKSTISMVSYTHQLFTIMKFPTEWKVIKFHGSSHHQQVFLHQSPPELPRQMQTVVHGKAHEDNQRENFDGADGPLHDLSDVGAGDFWVNQHRYVKPYLVGGIPTPLKNMSSSMGRMTSHIENGT